MDITCFDDLLVAARGQPDPQRLLFVFVDSALPADASAAQKAAHARGEGGELTPVLCVDKTPAELSDFAALAAESAHTGKGWRLVFVAAMADAGVPGTAEGRRRVDEALQRMVQMVKYGTISSLLAFDHAGDPVTFSPV
ncbi:ribonucleotide reductase subunit alpha [Castellaniella sp. GW247-6E4]|uniref:ribonucleotide reductase subunit alpha n=1 Tax=Castellaniella sp. GW247-6E4 TaxID=3140380 RepID=UPI0033156CAA